ncbi:hypothetical protein FRC00_009937 [Tulasnella sp. 408]|nr:hypothetical protein FRC00_009937 [Tulasnella sp. 408]
MASGPSQNTRFYGKTALANPLCARIMLEQMVPHMYEMPIPCESSPSHSAQKPMSNITAISRSKPNQALAEAVRASLSTRKNLESNAILFKFAWRLFSRDNKEAILVKLGEHAVSAGHQLICAMEDAIRFSRGGKKYESWREMCFKSMIECMGPRDGEIKYEFEAYSMEKNLVLKTATAYMSYITSLDGPFDNDNNAFAKKVMEQIRRAQIQSLAVAIALGIEHAHAKREFEGRFFKLWPPQLHGAATDINIRHMERTIRQSPTELLNGTLTSPASRPLDDVPA